MTETVTVHKSNFLIHSKPVQSFLSSLDSIKGAYQKAWLNYVAIREHGELGILKGQVHFFPTKPAVPETLQLTADIQAGCFEIPIANNDLQDFVSAVDNGVLKGPIGKLKFGWGQNTIATHSPYIPEAQQFRWSSLTLRRKNDIFGVTYRTRLDWSLRSAAVPYDNLDEVVAEYHCGPIAQDFSAIEILAPNVAAIAEQSAIRGSVARVEMNIAESLDESKAALGYRIVVGGRCIERGVKQSSNFSWRSQGTLKVGVIEFSVPVSSLVQCFAVYAGQAQHSWFIGDPSNSQNPRRVAFETFDPSLTVVTELLTPLRKSKAREFESGIAALFWMLGFNVVHLNDPRHGDAVDLIATAPDGSIALIECTVGLLKEESKLANLISRTYTARQRLNVSGLSHLSILPIIITSKAAGEISHELDIAHRDGVVVMAREDVADVLGTTILLPDANLWFQQALSHVEKRQAELNS